MLLLKVTSTAVITHKRVQVHIHTHTHVPTRVRSLAVYNM